MIKTLGQPCWRLVNPDGTDWYDDEGGSPHFDTEREARQHIAEYELDPDLTVAAFPASCATVTCDECDEMLEDDDGGYIVHFPDVEDARSRLDSYDFRAEPAPGVACWCEDCQRWPHAHLGPDLLDCQRCGEPADEHPEVDPPNRLRGHCDGQISLGGAA